MVKVFVKEKRKTKQTSKCEYCEKEAGWNNYLGLYICQDCRCTKIKAYKQNSNEKD